MPEPSVNKHRRNKEAEERLAKHYRDIGIKAVAAAVKPGKKTKQSHEEERKPVSIKRNENYSKRRENDQ